MKKKLISHQSYRQMINQAFSYWQVEFDASSEDWLADIDVTPTTLVVHLLPIMRQLFKTKPSLIIGLSNGADLIAGELKDLLERYQKDVKSFNYSPQFMNIIIGRYVPAIDHIWMLLTNKERDFPISEKLQKKVKTLAHEVKINLDKDSDIMSDKRKHLISWFINKIDQPLGLFLSEMPPLLYSDNKTTQHYTPIQNANWEVILPLFQLLLSETDAATFLIRHSAMVVDEIAYTGDALNKTKFVLNSFGVDNFELSLLIDYAEAQHDDCATPIGEDRLATIGYPSVTYGRRARKGMWSHVNLDMGPSYYSKDRHPDSIRRHIQAGNGYRHTPFSEALFTLLTKHKKQSLHPIFENSDNEALLRDVVAYSALYALNELKLSRKSPIVWKEKELLTSIRHRVGRESYLSVLSNTKDAIFSLFSDFLLIANSKYWHQKTFENGLWEHLIHPINSWSNTLEEIKTSEQNLFENESPLKLMTEYLTSKEEQQDIALSLQFIFSKIYDTRRKP